MTKATYYIVRCKANGVFLPERVLSSQFEFKYQPVNLMPRLFRNQRAAQSCINAWASGIWGRETSIEREGWEHPSYTVISAPMPIKDMNRDKAMLEAIPATLDY